ncbi:MAG: hypothetical protein J2O49_01005, partial [Sciscionella sp.]|nr:hypothetical protein [Sciscionella sp.]
FGGGYPSTGAQPIGVPAPSMGQPIPAQHKSYAWLWALLGVLLLALLAIVIWVLVANRGDSGTNQTPPGGGSDKHSTAPSVGGFPGNGNGGVPTKNQPPSTDDDNGGDRGGGGNSGGSDGNGNGHGNPSDIPYPGNGTGNGESSTPSTVRHAARIQPRIQQWETTTHIVTTAWLATVRSAR